MAFPCGAPCGAGTAGPAAHRVVPESQPTQCNTLGLARGSGPFEPPTGESSPPAPPSPPPLPSPSPMTEASMAPEATATRVCGASRPRARREIVSTGSRCAAVPWRSWRLPWRTRSAARSRPPTGARTCSSVDAGSWMTGPATWPAGVEGRTGRLIRPLPQTTRSSRPSRRNRDTPPARPSRIAVPGTGMTRPRLHGLEKTPGRRPGPCRRTPAAKCAPLPSHAPGPGAGQTRSLAGSTGPG